MADITAAMVKDLRTRTGVAMMDCKKALVATNGDIDEAIKELRKAGEASAVKKGSRIAGEGLVSVVSSADNKEAVILEINCETDFVAREDKFMQFVVDSTNCALKNSITDVETLSGQTLESGSTVENTRLELVTKIGENLSVRRIERVNSDNGVVGTYLHGGGTTARVATVVSISSDDVELAKDLAMQIAAMKPEYLDEASVPAARITEEKEILLAQSKEASAGKPAEIVEKIISGKIAKFIKGITLLGQSFVKDSNQTIAQLMKSKNATINSYVRYEVGEGIEKKVDDFVSEVMSQVKSD